MKNCRGMCKVKVCLLIGTALAALFVTCAYAEVRDELDSEIILIEETDSLEKQQDAILIEETGNDETIDLDMIENGGVPHPVDANLTQKASNVGREERKVDKCEVGLDEARIEHSELTKTDEPVKSLSYGHLAMSATCNFNSKLEARISGRIDGNQEKGDQAWSNVDYDYGESYLRYRSERWTFTLGTQKVIWGRVDEIPPNDRLSTQDLTRFVLNDLPDRRRARPMVRAEYFNGDNKLDIMILPVFRESEMPNNDSIWYPIDRKRGKILGMELWPIMEWIIGYAKIIDEPPDDDNGVGIRYSRTEEDFEYSVTAQHGRQTVPYFNYTLRNNTLTAIYPKSTSIGFDLGVEHSGFTWRFEATAIDKVMITQLDLKSVDVKGFNWVAALESFPGDGDSRVNLQLAGNHLLNTPAKIYERKNMYSLNGQISMPFASNRWRAKMDFLIGLDKQDVYLNPSIAYLGWEPHEIYFEAHIFDGDEGTFGGFHDKHSLVTFGWRSAF